MRNHIQPHRLPPIKIQKYERYLPSAFDESLSMLQKINMVIKYLHEYADVTFEMLEKWNEVYHWVTNEGLDQAIVDRLGEMTEDGTLDKIINENIFGELNNDIKTLRETLDKTVSDLNDTVQELKSDLAEETKKIKKDVEKEIGVLTSDFLDFKEDVGAQLEEGEINTLYKGEQIATKSIVQPTIVAYGDSNTRFYIGDAGRNGSISYAYSSVIEREIMKYPNLMGSKVINEGHSARTINWALDNYNTYVTRNNPDIVILGFGTNNIKTSRYTLTQYINWMRQMINRLKGDNITPIVLGIPWFARDYDEGLQHRLPSWNEALQKLCVELDVTFVDVYKMFTSANASVWFNESSTPKRHLNIMAQRALGEKLTEIIANLNLITSYKCEFTQSLFDYNSTSWFNRMSASVGFASYSLGTYSIDTIRIPAGASVTFNLQGRYALGFYPRENARVEVDPIGEISINATLNGGVYFPIQRVFDVEKYMKSNSTAPTTVTVRAISGVAYLNYISSEFNVRNINRGQPRDPIQISGADVPRNPSYGDRYMINELLKEVRYTNVNGGSWIDPSGYIAVGPTSQRTSFLASQVPKGFKYWDTTVNARYRATTNNGWERS